MLERNTVFQVFLPDKENLVMMSCYQPLNGYEQINGWMDAALVPKMVKEGTVGFV